MARVDVAEVGDGLALAPRGASSTRRERPDDSAPALLHRIATHSAAPGPRDRGRRSRRGRAGRRARSARRRGGRSRPCARRRPRRSLAWSPSEAPRPRSPRRCPARRSVSTVSWTAAWMASRSVTSAPMPITRPSPAIRSPASFAASSSRSTRATDAPRECRIRAVSQPMPRSAPVTRATFPATLKLAAGIGTSDPIGENGRRDRPLHPPRDRRRLDRRGADGRVARRRGRRLRGDRRPGRRPTSRRSAPRRSPSTRSRSASRSPTTTSRRSSTCSARPRARPGAGSTSG